MNPLKEMKWQSLLTAALYIIMGIILLVFPETTARTLCYVVGISGVVVGIFTVLAYLFRDVQKNYYRNDFVIGMVTVMLGAFILYKADLIIALIPFILGILVVFSGISKLQNCIDVRRMNYGSGLVFFVLAVMNIVFGIVLIMNPFGAVKVLFLVIGAGLLFSGITDTVATLYLSKKVRDYVNTQTALEQQIREVNGEDGQEEA